MIVTFCTPKYENEAMRLKQSAQERGYAIQVVHVKDLGDWAKNCAQKARVIRDALKHNGQILFLDADARINGNIDELLKPHEGVRLHIVTPDQFSPGMFAQRYRYHALRYGGMWNSGVMSIRRSPEVMEMINEWVAISSRCIGEWDQVCLQWAYEETGKKVKISDIPAEYRAGGGLINHKSAFHKYWKKETETPLRKILLLGSGPDLPEWWDKHSESYLNRGFAVVAMNNAVAVSGKNTHLWLIPNDYSGKHKAPLNVPCNYPVYPRATNPEGNWIDKPYWSRKTSTIMLSSLAHLLNEALLDECRILVHVVGCNMVYKEGSSHFYGKGSADPLRFSDEELEKAMRKIERAYRVEGCAIRNASSVPGSKLIFKLETPKAK